MAHIFKMSEWQSPNGNWNCGDVEDLANNSNAWWIPCRILEVPVEEYVNMLVNDFKVSYIKYFSDKNLLFFSWDNQTDMRKFKNFVNKKAKEVKAYVC